MGHVGLLHEEAANPKGSRGYQQYRAGHQQKCMHERAD
jgi:hypothetical protein